MHLSAGLRVTAAALVVLGLAGQALAAEKLVPVPKEPSWHVKCDGLPDNQSDGETALRLLAITAVVGLLAPPPEGADASKRKFGAEGVAACDQVLTGEKPEDNVNRRLNLILGRAIHRIEAKDYSAAIADVAMARSEAQAAGLMDNPYFRRSRAISFDQIEAAALVRMKRFAEADAMAVASFEPARYSLLNLLSMSDYSGLTHDIQPDSMARSVHLAKLYPSWLPTLAARQINSGLPAEAARSMEDFVQYDLSFSEVKEWHQSSWRLAVAALAHGLAGNWDLAARRAEESRTNDRKRVADGNPEESRAKAAEFLDLYEVLKLAKDGNLAGSRRMFTGRSAWLEVPLGAVLEANRRLRTGAKPEDLIGPLAKTADQTWEDHRNSELAELLAKDSDNKTLFELHTSYAKAGPFEGLSGKVWKTDKSKILIDPNTKVHNDQIAFLYATSPDVRYDAFLLHSALMARKEGKTRLLFMPFKNDSGSVFIRKGNPGEATMPAALSIDVEDVIASLSPIIPDPVTLKARRAAVKKKK